MIVDTEIQDVHVFKSSHQQTYSLLSQLDPKKEKVKDTLNVFFNGLNWISKNSCDARVTLSTLKENLNDKDVKENLEHICIGTGEDGLSNALQCERSMIVYFIPGFVEPVDLFLSWGGTVREEKMKENIRELYKKLYREGFESKERNFGHLFEFAHAVHMNLTNPGTEDNWHGVSLLFTNLTKLQRLEIGEKKLFWKPDFQRQTIDENEIILVTPLLATPDTLIMQATIYNNNDPKGFLEFNNSSPDLYYEIIRHLNEKFAFEIVQQFYTPLLQQNIFALESALGRNNISKNFLRLAGKRLVKKNDPSQRSPFTYKFLLSGEEKEVADLFKIITTGFDNNQTTIYHTVLKVQDSIYETVHQDISEFKIKGWRFPNSKNMNFSQLIRGLESAQRELQMKGRDHIIHPFQTFLLGTLIIDHFQRHDSKAKFHFLFNSIKESLAKDKISPDITRKNYLHFVKMAWFICASYHDVGYPIQLYESFSKKLIEEFTRLFCLGNNSLKEESFGEKWNLRIEQVLYDDPRTPLVLRRLVKGLAKLLYEPIKNDESIKAEYGSSLKFLEEALYFVINRMTFAKPRRHEMASTIVVALRFLNENSQEPFDLSAKLTFVERHILLPIMLHHIYQWPERLEEMLEKFLNLKKGEDDSVVQKGTSGEHMIRYVLEVLKKENILKFNNMPFTILLAVCDLFQEWGRPGSGKKAEWPIMIEGEFDAKALEEGNKLRLDVKLIYDEKSDSKNLQERDFNQRKKYVEFIEKAFDRGPFLKRFEAVFNSDIITGDPIILPAILD